MAIYRDHFNQEKILHNTMAKIHKIENTSEEKCSPSKISNTISNNARRMEPAVLPNGGYGWVIVFAAFMCAVIIYGILYSFGIFLVYFVDYYKTPKAEVAWIGSLFSGCLFLIGPLSGALTNKFGSRVVIAMGSIISTLAFLLSTTVPNIRFLTFTYGILGGIGFGLINVAMIVSVSYYFSSKRAFATGILMCGGSLGNFAVPQLVNFLLKIYDWKGTMIILSGLALNCMVFGFLMRPLSLDYRNDGSQMHHSNQIKELVRKAKLDRKHKSIHEGAIEQNFTCNMHSRGLTATSHKEVSEVGFFLPEHRFRYPNKPNVSAADTMVSTIIPEPFPQQLSPVSLLSQFVNKKPVQAKESSLTNSKAYTFRCATNRCRDKLSVQQIQRRFSLPLVKSTSAKTCLSAQDSSDPRISVQAGNLVPVKDSVAVNSKEFKESTHDEAIFYGVSNITSTNFEIQNSPMQLVGNMGLVTSTQIPFEDALSAPQSQNETESAASKCFVCIRGIVNSPTDIFDLPLLKETRFSLICVAYLIGMMGFFIPFVFLPHMSITKGIDREKSSFLISVLAIANFLGSFVIGYITDKSKMQVLDVTILCVCISAFACFIFPFCFSFPAIASVSVIYGFFIASKICLINIILVDMLGLEKLASAFGLISLFRGVGYIIGSPIAGAIFDTTGSYDVPFYMAGTCLLGSASLMILVSWITRRRKRQYTTNIVADLAITEQKISFTSRN